MMYEFWYDNIKPKYQCKAKLCYMDTDGCIPHIKNEDVYIETLQMMLKKDFINQVMQSRDHCLQEKRKSDWINERRIMCQDYDRVCYT